MSQCTVYAEDGEKIADFIDTVGVKSQVDLVVILDRSLGIGQSKYYSTYFELLQTIIKHYVYVHPDYVRIAAVTFGRDTSTPFDFINGEPKTKAEFLAEPDPPIDRLEFYNNREKGAGTNIKDSLEVASGILVGGRTFRDAKQVILLVTDGEYNVDEEPYGVATRIREDEKVTIFCIGIGRNLTPGNVRKLATGGAEYYAKYQIWEDLLNQRPYPVNEGKLIKFRDKKAVASRLPLVQQKREHIFQLPKPAVQHFLSTCLELFPWVSRYRIWLMTWAENLPLLYTHPIFREPTGNNRFDISKYK